jgi:hypothetical protein
MKITNAQLNVVTQALKLAEIDASTRRAGPASWRSTSGTGGAVS